MSATEKDTAERAPCITCGAPMAGDGWKEHHKRKECSKCKPPRGKAAAAATVAKAEEAPEMVAPSPADAPEPVEITAVAEIVEQPVETAAVKIKSTAVKIPAEAIAAVVDQEPRSEYFLGVVPGCNVYTVHSCGVMFIMARGGLDDEGNFTGPRGMRLMLSDQKVEDIKANVALKVLRRTGTRVMLMHRNGNNYQSMPGDEPLGKYLYMHKLGDNIPTDFWEGVPETMIA